MARTQRRPLISDVARATAVSPATVSLILNGRRSGNDRISPETRERVLRVVAELGYVPNQTARSLRRRKTERICLYVARLGVPYYDLLAQSLQQRAADHGYATIVILGFGREQEQRMFYQLRRGLADGVVLIAPSHLTSDDLSALARTGTAVLVYSSYLSGDGVDVIRVAEGEAGYQAMQYLFDKGRRRVGFIGPSVGEAAQVPRYQSYLRFMTEHGLPTAPGIVQDDSGISRRHAYECVQTMLELAEPPPAIFAASDLAAISAIWAIRNADRRVPDDLSLVWLSPADGSQGTLLNPTRFNFDRAAVGEAAVRLLVTRLKGECTGPQQLLIPCTFVVGSTTARP